MLQYCTTWDSTKPAWSMDYTLQNKEVLSQGALQMWVTPLQLTLYNGVMFTLTME